MKFGLKHLFFIAFLFAFALGVRALAITIENDAATGIGVLVAAFIASFGFTALGTKPSTAWLVGVATTFTMCVVDTIERVYQSPAMEYLWRHHIQGQYATDPQIGMIVTLVHTFLSTIVSCFGIGAGVLVRRLTVNRQMTNE